VAENNPEYPIGYGKPPKETRFQKGKSGNPKGRPKGSLNMATLFHRIVSERVSVTEGNRQKTMSRGEVILHQMCNKAAAGDARARHHFLGCLQTFRSDEDAGELTERQTSERKLFQNFVERLNRMAPKADTSSEEPEDVSNIIE
jgi:Family of unknown function (DUF5681)